MQDAELFAYGELSEGGHVKAQRDEALRKHRAQRHGRVMYML